MIKRKSNIFFLTSIVFFIVIMVFALNNVLSDEEYFMLLQKKKNVKDVKYHIQRVAEKTETSTGMTDATTGYGLNLMLIDELQEGYVKDLLTCMRHSQNGDYDDCEISTPVETNCALQYTETGQYRGAPVLKSYLPADSSGKPIWGTSYNGASAEEMTLEKFDGTVIQKIGGSNMESSVDGGSKTVFQYDYWYSRGYPAKIEGTGRIPDSEKGADHYYYPDVLASNNLMMTGFVTGTLDIHGTSATDYDPGWLSGMYALGHNRGEGGLIGYICGINYNICFRGRVSNYVSLSNVSQTERIELVDEFLSVAKEYKDGCSGAPYADDSIADATVLGYVLILHSDDWFISSAGAAEYNNKLDRIVSYWNIMFPSEQTTSAELSARIQSKTKSIPQGIKEITGETVSDSDCVAAYGSANAETFSGFPSAFHVVNKRSAVYKNKYSNGQDPYIVQISDTADYREVFWAYLMGGVVYSRMLYYAGLGNVDPTNPETYYSEQTTGYKPSANMEWMKSYGVDTAKLTKAQSDLLQTSYNITQIPNCEYCKYDKGLAGTQAQAEANVAQMDKEWVNDLTPTMLECAAFTGRSYRDTGFSGFEQRTGVSGFYSGAGTASTIWEVVQPEDLQPGDLLVCKQHVMIYLSGKCVSGGEVKCTVLESNVMAVPNMNRDGPCIRTRNGGRYFASDLDITNISDKTYYCLRLKARDTTQTKIRSYN